jgi:DNA-binding transcriptional MerR regulator
MNDEKSKGPLADEWPFRFLMASTIAEILGMSKRKVLLYVQNGLVRPVDPGEAHVAHRFGIDDLVKIAFLTHLERLGVTLRNLGRFAATYNQVWDYDDDAAKQPRKRSSKPSNTFPGLFTIASRVSAKKANKMLSPFISGLLVYVPDQTRQSGVRWFWVEGEIHRVLDSEPTAAVVNLRAIVVDVFSRLRSHAQL